MSISTLKAEIARKGQGWGKMWRGETEIGEDGSRGGEGTL